MGTDSVTVKTALPPLSPTLTSAMLSLGDGSSSRIVPVPAASTRVARRVAQQHREGLRGLGDGVIEQRHGEGDLALTGGDRAYW
ncbi:MAG: hypothetical protein R2873_15420 [Caldilineaceae bacterium]